MDFLHEYFISPIMANGGFNWANTLALGLLLVASASGVYKLLKKLNIPLDRHFAVSLLPFIYWATTTRVIRDYIYHAITSDISAHPGFMDSLGANISAVQAASCAHINAVLPLGPLADAQSWMIAWFTTPSTGSYTFTFLLALATLLVSIALQRRFKIQYWKPMLALGLIYCAWNTALLPFRDFIPLLQVLGLTACWAGLFFGVQRADAVLHVLKGSPRFRKVKQVFTDSNSAILTAHMLDASATFISLSFYGYSEQHVLPNLLIPAIGPAAMFVLKLAVVVPVLWYIDKETGNGRVAGMEGRDFKAFLKICVLILGLAPGLRDAIRLAVGV
jgi:uncharacterized membrane protein